MKFWIYTGFLLLGFVIGIALIFTTDHLFEEQADSDVSATMRERISRPDSSIAMSVGRMISHETPAMNEEVPLNKAMDILFVERKSPMRTRAFLKSRIQMMPTDQLNQALLSGEIQTDMEIREAARRLTTEDPDGTFAFFNSSPGYRLYGMDNVYAFVDTMLQTAADDDAPAMMKRLQSLKRGGAQFDLSTRFSNYWAKIDPVAAAQQFEELIYLRNMPIKGDQPFPRKVYARTIVESWIGKDEEAMREFIHELPDGESREAFQSALEHLDSPK